MAGAILANAAKGHATALGRAVGSQQRDADQFKEAHNSRRHGRSAVRHILHAPAKRFASGLPQNGYTLCQFLAIRFVEPSGCFLLIEGFDRLPELSMIVSIE